VTFSGNECNGVENKLTIFEMLLGEDTGGDIVGSIGLDNGFEVRFKVSKNRSRGEGSF